MTAIAFAPVLGGTVASANLAATSANVALSERVNGATVRVVNPNTVVAFCRFGIGAQTATLADVPVPPGGMADIYVSSADNVAVIGQAAGTLPVYFSIGA